MGLPQEEPGTMLEGGTEKIQQAQLAPGARGEQEGRIAQNELLQVLRRVNVGLDLCHRRRKHLGRRKASSLAFAMDSIHNSVTRSRGFQLLGCMCSLHFAPYLYHKDVCFSLQTSSPGPGVLKNTPYTASNKSHLRE